LDERADLVGDTERTNEHSKNVCRGSPNIQKRLESVVMIESCLLGASFWELAQFCFKHHLICTQISPQISSASTSMLVSPAGHFNRRNFHVIPAAQYRSRVCLSVHGSEWFVLNKVPAAVCIIVVCTAGGLLPVFKVPHMMPICFPGWLFQPPLHLRTKLLFSLTLTAWRTGLFVRMGATT
jgi:hypothetical protein